MSLSEQTSCLWAQPRVYQMSTFAWVPTSLTLTSRPGNFFSHYPEGSLLIHIVLIYTSAFLLSSPSYCSQGEGYCLPRKNEFQSLGLEGNFHDNNKQVPTSAL